MRRWLLVGLAAVLAACSSGTDVSGSPTSFVPTPALARTISLTDGSHALAWGSGAYGVVLIGPSEAGAAGWDPVGAALAAKRMAVVALDARSETALRAGIAWLRDAGAERVAVLAAGAADAAAFAVGASNPELVDQMICVSCAGDPAALGEFPKLFAAGKESASAADTTRLTSESRGEWNAELLVPGKDAGVALFRGASGGELLAAVIRRFEERR